MTKRVSHWPLVIKVCEANRETGATLDQIRDGAQMIRRHSPTLVCQYIKRGYLFAYGAKTRRRYFLTEEDMRKAAPLIDAMEAARNAPKVKRVIPWEETAVGKVHAHLVAAGDAGLSFDDIKRLCNISNTVASVRLAELRRLGKCFMARGDYWFRNFATMEQAAAYKLIHCAATKRNLEVKERAQKREQAKQAARAKKAAELAAIKAKKAARVVEVKAKPAPVKTSAVRLDPNAQAIIPAGLKPTLLPCQPGRFEVSGPVVGGFATMGVGRYLEGRA